VQSSEKAGDLSRGLRQIADYMEQRSQINNRIRGALTYPAFVIVLAIGVVILMVTTVLPPILKLFKSFNAELPPLTRFAIALIQIFTDYKFQILLAVVILVAGIWVFSRIPKGRLIMDGWILKIPVFGPIIIQNNLGHFCRTASMLMTAGLPLPAIMDISIKVVGRNRVILKSLTNLKTRLMQGEGLAVPISQDKLFPRMMARMIAVGEQTGTLDASLATLATYYEERANKKIQSLITLIEPVMTIAIGLGIAFIMISMIMPIYGILNKVH
jgi:type IV pilus assembly protein PilC